MAEADIVEESFAGGAARRLTTQSTDELRGRYGGSDGLGGEPAPEEFVAFLVGYVDGDAVTCGGIRRVDAETVEVKRMYVAPSHRGGGLSRLVLTALEGRARELGYRRAILETGLRQPESLGLYRSTGYVEIPPYGPFADDPESVCFEKLL